MSKGTTARNIKIGDPLWRAVLVVAKHHSSDASKTARQLLGDWVAREAAADPMVAGEPDVRRYLSGHAEDQADDELDTAPTLARVRNERYNP